MTAAQSLQIFEILNKHFKNENESKIVVQEIEQIIETKINSKTEVLATKLDLADVKTNLSEVKADILKWLIVLFMPFYIGMIVFLVKFFA